MTTSKFVYVTYIRTTPESLWEALLKPEFTRVYWAGVTQQSEWKQGASWKMILGDGRIADSGEIVEIEKPKRLVIKWRNEFRPELKAEGYSRCTIQLEQADDAVKLTILHEIDQPESKLIEAVSGGWPKVLASLKSLLETGNPLDKIVAAPKG
jgi:uncharacterized protein YndB with AHSA1/START domain